MRSLTIGVVKQEPLPLEPGVFVCVRTTHDYYTLFHDYYTLFHHDLHDLLCIRVLNYFTTHYYYAHTTRRETG